MTKKSLSLILSISLILTQPVFAQGAAELNIGKYLNQMPVVKIDSFRPAHLRYISYDLRSNDFKLLLDQGDAKLANSLNSSTPKLQDATQELFNYFLIGLSLPNEKFWVNLRPDAPQQIIDPELEKTDMGKIMLEADLQLKKDTAGLTSPQNPEGKEYWDKLYKKAGELFPAVGGSAFGGGTENITIPTITRPWIVPGEVIIRESEDSAYIYKANLKVMLEEDYLNNQKTEKPKNQKTDDYNFSDPRMKELNKYSTQLIKELILPKLTQEINTSKKYAQLRQVFFSLILSRWFKDKYKGKPGQYSQLIDSRNLDKLNSKESWNKEYYFNEYKKSFQQGEYNLKEQITTPTGQVIRSYVSGGANMTGDYKTFVEGGFRSIGTSSPIDWQTASLIGVGFAFAVGGATVFYKFIKKAVLPMLDYNRKFKIIEGGINAALDYADKYMLSADDAILLHKRFRNYQDMGVEEVIEIIEGTIKLLKQPYPKLKDKIKQANREKVITILEGSLKTAGSSPLNPVAMRNDGYSESGNDERFLRLLALPSHAASPVKSEKRELRNKILKIAEKADKILGQSVLEAVQEFLKRLQPNKDWIAALETIRAVLDLSHDTLPQEQMEESGRLLAQLEELKSQIEEAALYNSDFYFKITKENFPARDIVHLNGISVQTNNYNNDIYHNAPFNKDFIISLIASYDVSSWSVFFEKLKEKVEEYFQDDFAQVKKLSPKTAEQFKSNLEDYKIHYIAMALVFFNPIQGKKTKKTIDQSLKAIESYFKSGNEGSSPLAPQQKAKEEFIKHFKYLDRKYGDSSSVDENIKDYWRNIYKKVGMFDFNIETRKYLEIIESAIRNLSKNKEGAPDKYELVQDINMLVVRFQSWANAAWKEYCQKNIDKVVSVLNDSSLARPAINKIATDIIKILQGYIADGDYAISMKVIAEINSMVKENNGMKYFDKFRTYEAGALTIEEKLLAEACEEYLRRSSSAVKQSESSPSLTQELTQAQHAALETGGIDFTRINYLTRPMGSFQGLDLRLPLLSIAELEGIDIKQELAALEQMINARIDVSTDRLKRLLAAMSQKDVFTSQREIQLLPLLLRLCWLKEERGVETTPDFRAVLLIADTGLFVEQGNTKYSLN